MKTALITGVGKGIGKALAQIFLEKGYFVIGTSTSGAIDYSNDNIAYLKLDLSDSAIINSCVHDIEKLNKKIDILINNAGVLLDDNETSVKADLLRKTLEVNVIGTANFTEQVIPMLNKEAHLIFLSSQAGSIGDMDHIEDSHFPYHYPAYKISKCALNMYVRTLSSRLSHEGDNMIVSAVHPGWVKTDMGGDNAPVTPEQAAANIFKLAISNPPTGQFWFNGEKYPW